MADQIVDETTASRIIEKEQKSSRRLGAGAITLLILGFPLWFSSLLLAGFIVVLSFYIVLWTFTICMWVVELPFFIFSFISKGGMWLCKRLTRGSVFLTKKVPCHSKIYSIAKETYNNEYSRNNNDYSAICCFGNLFYYLYLLLRWT